MDNKEFLNLLNRPDPAKWLLALNADYSPHTQTDIQAILMVSQAAQPDVQRDAFEVVKDCSDKVAAPILIHLARSAIEPELRKNSIERLCRLKGDKVTETILICAVDEHLDPQEAAITCLGNRSSPQIIPLLLIRIQQPEEHLNPQWASAADRIRKAALSALAEHAEDSVINPLIEAALRYPQHRREAFRGLKVIGKVKVANALIDTIVDGPAEGLPAVDLDFRLQSLYVIAAKPPRRGNHLMRYRSFICKLYQEQLHPGRELDELLIDQLTHFFDKSLGKCVLERLEHYGGNPDVSVVTSIAQQSAAVLAEVEINDALPYWCGMLDMPQDQIAQSARETLVDVLGDKPSVPSKFLARSIREDSSATRHQGNRLQAVVRTLAPEVVDEITTELLPLLGDSDEQVRTVAAQYLRVCQKLVVGTDGWFVWLELLMDTYTAKRKIQPALREYIAQIRDRVTPAQRASLWELLLDSSEDTLLNLLEHLMSMAQNPVQMLSEMLGQVSERHGRWGRVRSVLDSVSEQARRSALVNTLGQAWNSYMWGYLANDGPSQIAELSRKILADPDYEISVKSRARVIEDLGKQGGVEDAPLMISELSSKEPTIRATAAAALGNIGSEQAEEKLGRVLHDPKTAVVQSAINSLKLASIPTVETVRLLQERVETDPDNETRELAKEALEVLLERHLAEDQIESINGWLVTLQTFGRSDSGEKLESLLNNPRLEEDPDLRAKVATAIGVCCDPTIGLAIINRRLTEEPLERNPEVQRALEAAGDALTMSPDMALLRLLNEVTGIELDRDELLVGSSFDELFSRPNTIALLRDKLPKVLRARNDPDTFITRVDGIADVLGDEVEDALVREFPDSATLDGRRGYGSQIDFLGRASQDLKHAARALHNLREKSDLAHVEDDRSGQIRPGCDRQDQVDAQRHFQVIVVETMKYLMQDLETHRSSQE